MAIQKIQFFKEVNTHNIPFSKTAFRTVAEKIFQDYNKTLHFINIVFVMTSKSLEVNKNSPESRLLHPILLPSITIMI